MFRRRQKYKLEIGAERSLSKSLVTSKASNSYSNAQKIVFMVIAAAIFLATGVAGIFGATPQAHAVKVDPISDMLCPTVSNGTSYLGGISQPIIDGFEGTVGGPPWEGLFGVWSIPKADQENIIKGNPVAHQWTTLERYGYYGTQYTNWIGMQTHYPMDRLLDEVFSDGKLPFMGTGGNPGGFGTFTYVLDGESSSMFSHNLMDCIPIASHANIAAANTFQAINQTINSLTLNAYYLTGNLSFADDNSILRPLGEVFETVIAGDGNTKGLKDLLFLEFMLPLIAIGALAVFIKYARDWKMLSVVKHVAWILFISILGMLLLSKPLIISSTVDNVVNTVTGALGEAILGSGSNSPECSLPDSEPQHVEREIACYMWIQNVYSFWVEGQFGMSYEEGKTLTSDPAVKAGTSEYGEPKDADTYVGLNSSNWAGINSSSYAAATSAAPGSEEKKGAANFLALQALGYDPKTYYPDYETMFENSKPIGGPELANNTRGVLANFNPHLGTRQDIAELRNWPYYQMDTSAVWPVSNGYNHSEVAYNQLVINDNVYWKNPTNASTMSILSIMYSIVPSIVILLLSLTLVTLQVSMSVLIIILPFFLAISLIPSFGSRIFYKWVSLILGIGVRRIFITLFFFLFLKLYFIILNIDMDFRVKMLIIAVLSLVVFQMKDTVINLVTNGIRVGGVTLMQEEEKRQYSNTMNKFKDSKSLIEKMKPGGNKQSGSSSTPPPKTSSSGSGKRKT